LMVREDVFGGGAVGAASFDSLPIRGDLQ
jgi:hypothetical protein